MNCLNARIIDRLAPAFIGYPGRIIVVSNPVEILTYLLAVRAKLNPYSISGYNPDALRGVEALVQCLHDHGEDLINKKEGDVEKGRWYKGLTTKDIEGLGSVKRD